MARSTFERQAPTVLFTFALGTAAGDLTAERLNLGYWVSALIFAGLIGAVALTHYRFRLNAVTAFWIAYILTRPLGASLGESARGTSRPNQPTIPSRRTWMLFPELTSSVIT